MERKVQEKTVGVSGEGEAPQMGRQEDDSCTEGMLAPCWTLG